MKVTSIILTILLSGQFAFASLSSNTANCANQKKGDRNINVASCDFNFSNLYPSCKGKENDNRETRGTDYTPRGS